MKTKKIIILSMLALVLSCSDEKQVESDVISLSEMKIALDNDMILIPENKVESISKKELAILEEKIASSSKFASASYCGRELIRVYWNGAAESDFVLRDSIRRNFMENHGLDGALRVFPETVEIDTEIWIFREDGTHTCHTQGVMATINNNGNDEVNTDDD